MFDVDFADVLLLVLYFMRAARFFSAGLARRLL
jgi:hypothetical protein